MSGLGGIARKYDGNPVDRVRVFPWPDGPFYEDIIPDANGAWNYEIMLEGNYGITYIAEGCQPITHGPYYIEIAGDSYWDKVISLLRFDGDITDEAGFEWSVYDGREAYEPAQQGFNQKFLGHIRHDGATGLLDGDFTAECFIEPQSGLPPSGYIFCFEPAEVRYYPHLDIVWKNSGAIRIAWRPTVGGTAQSQETRALTLSRHHVALVKEGDLTKIYVDGSLEFSDEISYHDHRFMAVGGRAGTYYTGSGNSNFYIDEVRITKGVARYTENFMPPTKPFPSYGLPE